MARPSPPPPGAHGLTGPPRCATVAPSIHPPKETAMETTPDLAFAWACLPALPRRRA